MYLASGTLDARVLLSDFLFSKVARPDFLLPLDPLGLPAREEQAEETLDPERVDLVLGPSSSLVGSS
jgi:hypothetical protein